MKKYFAIFRIFALSKLEYRFELISVVINEVVGIAGVMILWNTVFKSTPVLGGLNQNQTVLYYLLIPLISIATSVDFSDKLGDEIRDGHFSKYLLRPYRLDLSFFSEAVAQKIHTLILIMPIYLAGVLIYVNVTHQTFQIGNFLLSVLFAILGFFLHYLLDLNLSWLAFWVNDVWAFVHLKNFTFSIFGGSSFPLNFLSGFLRKIFDVLPFKFLFYIPAAYLMGIRPADNLIWDFLGITAWMLILAVSGKLLYQKGIKYYEAYGN